MAWTSKAAPFSAGILAALVALIPFILPKLSALPSLSYLDTIWPRSTNTSTPFVCAPQAYTTHIVSTDPLVIYIHDFLSDPEISALLEAGDPLFKPSLTTKRGRAAPDKSRTSKSAGLPRGDAAVECVVGRAEHFMGAMFVPEKDEMGAPQLVRYGPGEKFDLHYDWFPRLQRGEEGRGGWNRPASFFVTLEDGCEAGETYFPNVSAAVPQGEVAAQGGEGGRFPWREHEGGGIAFQPVKGNALFWVNIRGDGTGDERTRHAGLPLEGGRKTAMNIWPRRYE